MIGQDRRGNRPVQDRAFVPQGQGDRPGIRFPAVHRPSFTLGGTGASLVYDKEKFEDLLQRGLEASPIHEVLIDKAL